MAEPSSASDLRADLRNKVGGRTQEIKQAIESIQEKIIPFIEAADSDAVELATGQGLRIQSSTEDNHVYAPKLDSASGNITTEEQRPVLVDPKKQAAKDTFDIRIPDSGQGLTGLLAETDRLLASSVNTFAQGFLDKLYGASNAPSMAADMLLSTLNTNLHVKHVSPALSDVERHTAAELARLIGWSKETDLPYAGGVSQPGGSASNQLALLIARATMFPETREKGNNGVPDRKQLVIFTSAHSHYSLEKAAMMAGLGFDAVRKVPVDAITGQMDVPTLERMIEESKATGTELPFFVNATAGTTVLGSYDRLDLIAPVAKKHGLWVHVDGSWGGSVLLSEKLRQGRLDGIDLVDSFSICPHKMLGVAVICSFLIGRDVRLFKAANTLAAGYLFHSDTGPDGEPNLTDLADLTPQCGRRGDALKMYLSWVYYGREGYSQLLEGAFDVAGKMADLLASEPSLFELVMDPAKAKAPCLQVCFFWVGPVGGEAQPEERLRDRVSRSALTAAISHRLIDRGFMVDYAPMIEKYVSGQEAESSCPGDGKLTFLRVVINRDTALSTVVGLISAIKQVAATLKPTEVWA